MTNIVRGNFERAEGKAATPWTLRRTGPGASRFGLDPFGPARAVPPKGLQKRIRFRRPPLLLGETPTQAEPRRRTSANGLRVYDVLRVRAVLVYGVKGFHARLAWLGALGAACRPGSGGER